jgi:hypothetical protein
MEDKEEEEEGRGREINVRTVPSKTCVVAERREP